MFTDHPIHRALEAVGNMLDGGELRVYAGAAPALDEDPVRQLLAVNRFTSPAFQVPVARTLLSFPLQPEQRAPGEGEAGFFRCIGRDGVLIQQGTVGKLGSGADLELDRTYIQRGSFFAIETFTLQM